MLDPTLGHACGGGGSILWRCSWCGDVRGGFDEHCDPAHAHGEVGVAVVVTMAGTLITFPPQSVGMEFRPPPFPPHYRTLTHSDSAAPNAIDLPVH